MRSLLALAAACVALADDRITSLPGWNGDQVMYAGYINVNASSNRNIFYWHVQATTNPSAAPLVFWTNGGPGCSGVGGGMMSELGPVYPSQNSTGLVANPYTWCNIANCIFLEQPAGVGFSYSDNPADYTVGDLQAAIDFRATILGFLQRYPQYASNPIWIAAESYGGHYMPSTAAYIIEQNLAGAQPQINFAGVMVGNAWTVAGLDNTGAVEFWRTRSMVSNDTANGILSTCNMSDIGPLFAGRRAKGGKIEDARAGALGFIPSYDASGKALTLNAKTCDDYQNDANNDIGNIDIYDAYTDVLNCEAPAAGRSAGAAAMDAAVNLLKEGSNGAAGCSLVYDPCVDGRVQTYLNRPDVIAAIHANASASGPWTDCSGKINYSRFDLLTSMLPKWQYILENHPTGRYLIYSGDVDAVVPTMGTQLWLAALGLPVSQAWAPYTVNGQTGGWTQTYAGPANSVLTFATVRNAGHMVPYTQQERALYMFTQFLNNQPF